MKVKFVKTGTVVDFVAADWLWAFLEAGLVTEVKDVTIKNTEPAATRWWVEGRRKDTSVHVHCTGCKQTSRWLDVNDTLKFEHCKKTEQIPHSIVLDYMKQRNIW